MKTLVYEEKAAGNYRAEWSGHNEAGNPVASGVYFYRLVKNNFVQTKKIVLLKWLLQLLFPQESELPIV